MTFDGFDSRTDSPARVICHVDVDCFYAACERLREPALEGEPVVVGMGYEPDDDVGAVATASYEAREFGVESAMPISEALEKLPPKREAATDPDVDVEEAGFYRPVEMSYYKDVSTEVREILYDAVEGYGADRAAQRAADRSTGEGERDVTDGSVSDERTASDGRREAPPDERTASEASREHASREHASREHASREPSDPGDGVVREVSIDEAYLDVTGVGWQGAERFGAALRERIEREVGVTASVGVAPNMSTAKVASDHDKPDGLTVVEPDEVREFLGPLPVEELHGVGPVTAEALGDLDIETAADLAEANPSTLEERFGERGREIRQHARGRDDREVTPVGRPKSLSSEKALPPTGDAERKRELVASLADEVAERAGAEGALYKTIGIKVVTPPFETNTRARSLPGPVDDPELVESVALELLSEFGDDRVRKLGVRVSNLDFSQTDQVSLDEWDHDTRDGTGMDRDARGGTDDPTVTGGGDGEASPSPERDGDDTDDSERTMRGQTRFGDFG